MVRLSFLVFALTVALIVVVPRLDRLASLTALFSGRRDPVVFFVLVFGAIFAGYSLLIKSRR